MSVVVVLEVVLMLAMTAVLIPPVLVVLVLVTMAVLDVLVGMAAVLDVLVVTRSSGLKTIFMITTATVADNATNPNKTRSPIITNFLRDTDQPPIASFIPPCLPESSTLSQAVGAGPAIRTTLHTGIAMTVASVIMGSVQARPQSASLGRGGIHPGSSAVP